MLSLYNHSVTGRLLAGALWAYSARCFPATKPGDLQAEREGCVHPAALDAVHVWHASGAFEIVPLAAEAARSGRYDAVVALGCIIRGETTHDQHLAAAVTTGLAQIAASGGPGGRAIAVGLGVLTVNTPKQAAERAGGKFGNKGAEAMLAALDTLEGLKGIRLSRRPPAAIDLLESASRLPDKASDRSRGRARSRPTKRS